MTVTPPKTKLSFGKAYLISCAACVAYAWLIPTHVLSDYPVVQPFVAAMESALPAIPSLARLSPIPEVVRFYYASMWLAFPVLYLLARIFWVRSVPTALSATLPRIKAFAGILVCLGTVFMVVMILGLNVVPEKAMLKSLATGGRGNLLAAAIVTHPLGIGMASHAMWMSAAMMIEFAGHFWRHIFRRA